MWKKAKYLFPTGRKESVISKTQKSIRRIINISKQFKSKRDEWVLNQLKELKVVASVGQETEVGWELIFFVTSVDELYSFIIW